MFDCPAITYTSPTYTSSHVTVCSPKSMTSEWGPPYACGGNVTHHVPLVDSHLAVLPLKLTEALPSPVPNTLSGFPAGKTMCERKMGEGRISSIFTASQSAMSNGCAPSAAPFPFRFTRFARQTMLDTPRAKSNVGEGWSNTFSSIVMLRW